MWLTRVGILGYLSGVTRRWVAMRGPRAGLRAGALLLAAVFAVTGCSRSGAISGEVIVHTPSGETTRGARISVFLVVPSDAFEREWAEAVTAFQREVAPSAEAQKAAEHQAEEARLAWDRALAVRGKHAVRRSAWTLTLREDSNKAGSQGLWRNVRATDALVFQSKQRVWEIVRKHERQAQELVVQHATQRVQTDELGHYVIVKVPAGRVYVYAHLQEKKADYVWFIPIQVEKGTQRVDLTESNQRHWSFVP